MSKPFRTFIHFFAACVVLALAPMTRAAPSVQLAGDGAAKMKVVVPEKATPRVREAAATLARYLGRISDANFEVVSGDGTSGIAVGLLADFPGAAAQNANDANDPTHREDYVLQSHAGGVYVAGATELAVEHAVWDLLYRLGHRQFFQGEDWEIVPHTRDLSIAVDAHEHPAYYARKIWFGYGAWDYGTKPYAEWCAKNRLTSGIELNTGHSYEGILHTYKKVFDAHPEYLALVNGKRTGPKICIANPDLRKLVIDHALAEFAKNPALDSVSCDPSDGGGWCECDECAKLGSISDRALFLANEVARAVNAKYPGKLVGMYAYNYHSPPPNISADPHVVVSVATAFIKGGMTLDEIMAGWSKKCSMLGIREYYEVHPWDRDMPAAARGGNIEYLKRTIPEFYAKGARFLSAESGESFAPDGLGYYLAGRMLWNPAEAQHVDALVDDFLARAFGPAKEPMREFYHQLDGSSPHLVPADQLGRMFRSIEAAQKLADTPAIHARLNDLLLYSRYVDLYRRYEQAKGSDHQQAFEILFRHAYRMRKTMMVHVLGLVRDLPHRDRTVIVPTEAQWNVPEGKNPWKTSTPFAPEELAGFLSDGIARYPLTKLDFTPVAFSDDLVSAAALHLPDVHAGNISAGRGKQIFYTRVETAPAKIELAITGGMIAHYRDRGNVKIELWKLGGASQSGERETLISEDRSVPPDGTTHTVSIPIKEPGVYKLVLNDGMDRTQVKWTSTLPVTIKSTTDEPMNAHYNDTWQLYFYVPHGTRVLGLFGGKTGDVCNAGGKTLFSFNGRETNYYSVNIPDGEDGKLWSIKSSRGPVRLLTVPPYFAPRTSDLLLPREVVAKDAAK